MAAKHDRIIQGDCVDELAKLRTGSVALVFADPPFNIGYAYDVCDDNRSSEDYLAWSKRWFEAVIRVLTPEGAFWLSIGDEYAAELKVLATRELGLTCRSWVVWYYTFGVHCKTKFTRSHAHLFHFVKDPKKFTFNDMAVRVPSARQLVYADKRANPKGRVPDDTWLLRPTPHKSWILRPQDLPEGFTADGDTWYYPRVCGTFKQRMGFHGCQMPEQLLGRIISACSNENDLVLDPFSGSGTTPAVAKKLGRRYLGIDISKQYVAETTQRLKRIRPGDALDGAEDPLTSVANTANGRVRVEGGRVVSNNGSQRPRNGKLQPKRRADASGKLQVKRPKRTRGLDELHRGIVEAFKGACRGFSTDRVIADPELNDRFVEACRRLSLEGDPTEWNVRLLGLRKAKQLSNLSPTERTKIPRDDLDQCEFASEIAMAILIERHGLTLDRLFCDPDLAREFDSTASGIAPGWSALHYRWAALGIRKRRKLVTAYGAALPSAILPVRFRTRGPVAETAIEKLPAEPNIYVLSDANNKALYVGATENLRRRFGLHFGNGRRGCPWANGQQPDRFSLPVRRQPFLAWFNEKEPLNKLRGLQSYQIARCDPRYNLKELAASA